MDTELPFDEAVTAFLNQGGGFVELMEILANVCGDVWGLTNEPPFSQVLATDLNADGELDLLVSITLPYGGGFGEAHVMAFIEDEGRFEPHVLFRRAGAGSRADGLYAGGGPEILEVKDLNRDGIADVLFVVRWETFSEVYLAEDVAGEFRSLIEVYDDILLTTVYNLTLQGAEPSLGDLEGDGLYELILVSGLPKAGKAITEPVERHEVWAWNGSVYERSAIAYVPDPTYRIQALMLGDFAFEQGDLDQALAFYQQAVFDEALLGWYPGFDPGPGATPVADPDERSRIDAYGRYRIMLTHAVQRNKAGAQLVSDSLLQRIATDSPGGPYAQLAAAFWGAFSGEGSYSDGCSAAIDYASSRAGEILDPFGTGHYGVYGRSLEPQDMCPYPRQGY